MANLPNAIGMLPLQAQGRVQRLLVVLSKIINGHVAIVHTDGHQKRIPGMDIAAHHTAFRHYWKKQVKNVDKFIAKLYINTKNTTSGLVSSIFSI